jgi:hypothetical protein
VEALRQSVVPGEEGEEAVKCSICGREGESDLCVYHKAAMERVKEAYPRWVKAYGAIEWKDYLDNVKRNFQTGQWAREIAEFLVNAS